MLVWSGERDPRDAARRFRSVVPLAPGEPLANSVQVDIPRRGHLWKPDGYRTSSWRLFLLN